jgi:hypothetical protein
MGKVHARAKHSQNKKPKFFLVGLCTLGFYLTTIEKYLVICKICTWNMVCLHSTQDEKFDKF